MEFSLDDAVRILSRTPAVLDAWLRDLPEPWILADEGGESWSAFDIVGHLIHGERTDWIARARIILEHGESGSFGPFDRFAQEHESQGKTLVELLDELARLRAENLQTLRELDIGPEQLALRGRHPELGAVTLGQLLATWTAHDLSHLRQIARVMAKQYADAIGPWKAYFPVMEE